MNGRIDFSKHGQMVMRQEYGNSAHMRNYDIGAPSETELKLAQQSLFLLKSKMARTQQSFDRNSS